MCRIEREQLVRLSLLRIRDRGIQEMQRNIVMETKFQSAIFTSNSN